ncbi:hypothetical protein Q9R19_02180 [Microbacterium sp. ARD32]|uniref:hypothetical protein n=1 Tax=Microbacterium sp. ARD32 TaxID=2962577 RepID=UPI002881023B|nr:hypothetical protein [Microbacterium sp. ARD32]MDT0156425.1 hypothetical protein [Microbacterium sp. ARD32]
MNETQQSMWSALEASGDYDPGSVHLLGSRYGVDAWEVTRSNGRQQCILITRGSSLDDDDAGSPTAGCAAPEADGASPDEGDESDSIQANLAYTEDGVDYIAWANRIDDVNGDSVVLLRRNDANAGWDWRSQYTDAELELVDQLEGAGLDGETLRIIAYDGDLPVWTGFSDTGQCVAIVKDGVASHCGELTPESAPLELQVDSTVYELRVGYERGDSLTIYRGIDGAGEQE